MKREIKFRGKSTKGQWYYGYLTVDAYGHLFIDTLSGNAVYTQRVFPESVGQYTGLKDKNGVDIYEGDIVKPNATHISCNCSVEINPFGSQLNSGSWSNWFAKHVWDDCEIIGNIYENPELLIALPVTQSIT